MMDFDSIESIKDNDPQNMLAEIDGLPDQLSEAWRIGQALSVEKYSGRVFKHILVAGMGGSAIGADLLAAYVQPLCQIPVIVHRDYGLPAFARGTETLVVCCSHSGNTEETIDVFDAARSAGCSLLAICTGGKLAEKARDCMWKFNHAGMPRAAVGYSFGLLLLFFTRLGLIPNPEEELLSAVTAMRTQMKSLQVDVPAVHNPAKRMAAQLEGNWVNVLAADMLVPVARRWKCQINELAKAGAGFEALPEADHNTLAGLLNPSHALKRVCTLFLHAPADLPGNRKRLGLTREVYKRSGLKIECYHAQGESRLAQIWTALHFGDYLAYYLAAAYGINPTPIIALEEFKKQMKA